MKCGIYVRVSTGKQETDNQLDQLRDFAGSQGWIVVKVYADQLTGKNSDREQFQQMFQDASKRRFDVLLFWESRPAITGGCARNLAAP
jgi:DNA invertase Pin-like site-specific DNA recombinase